MRAETLRTEVIDALSGLEEAANLLRGHLRALETTIRRLRRQIESGSPVIEAALAVGISAVRESTSGVIRDVQAARHRTQRALFKAAAAEGATLAEVARTWGVSRQLVSRIAKEPLQRRSRRAR